MCGIEDGKVLNRNSLMHIKWICEDEDEEGEKVCNFIPRVLKKN